MKKNQILLNLSYLFGQLNYIQNYYLLHQI